MSIRMPESIKLPKTSLLESLGQGLGTGLQAGGKQALSNILSTSKYNREQKLKSQEAVKKSSANFASDLNKAAKDINIDLESKDPIEMYKLKKLGSDRILKGENPQDVIQDILVQTSPELQKYLQEQGDAGTANLSQGLAKSLEEKDYTFDPNKGKRHLISDIASLDRSMKESQEKQKQMTLMERLKGTAEVGQNIASGLSLGIVPKKELSEKYQHLQGASNFLKEVSSYVPLSGLMGAGKSLGVKVGSKLFPNIALATKVLGAFGGAAGGTVADTVSKSIENKKLPSPAEVAKEYAKWLAFEGAFALMPSISKVDKPAIKEFVEKTGATEKEAAEYLKDKIKAGPAEGEASRVAEKTRTVEKEATKAEIGKKQLTEKAKAEKKLVQKAAKSPLEDIFKPEKEVKHRAETIAKKEALIADVEKRLNPVRSDLKEVAQEITDLKLQKRNAKILSNKEKIQNSIDRAKFHQSELTDKVKDLQFEKKYGTKPKSYPEISEDIEKSFKKLKEEIKSPTPVSAEKMVKDLESHNKAIGKSSEIVRRGDLLSPERVDYYTRLKRQYADAYGDMIKENSRIIEDFSGKKTAKAKNAIKEADQMNKVLEKRLERANADIVIQKNKRAIQKMTSGAKGAFHKKELAKLRSDIELFQKNLFKQNKLKSMVEEKTSEAFRALQTNPSEKTARTAAESQGQSYDKIKKEAENLGKELGREGVSEQVKQGKIKGFLDRAKKNKVTGPALVALNAFLKVTTGKGLPNRLLKSSLRKMNFKTAGYASTLIASLTPLVTRFIRSKKNESVRKELKQIKDPVLRNRYIQGLKKKGYSAARINKIKAA